MTFHKEYLKSNKLLACNLIYAYMALMYLHNFYVYQQQHGLKMTLKKGPGLPKPPIDAADVRNQKRFKKCSVYGIHVFLQPMPLTVRIPLPILLQHNKKVTKRIPKKKTTAEGRKFVYAFSFPPSLPPLSPLFFLKIVCFRTFKTFNCSSFTINRY